MTLTFENNNDVVVYALEKIITYDRKNRYIFAAQSIWWIASVTGLTEQLVTHIDNLRSQGITELVGTSVTDQPNKEGITTPQDIQECSNINIELGYIHPDRITQVDNTTNGNCSLEHSGSESGRASRIIKEAKEFISQSQKEQRRTFKGKADPLSCTRSGIISAKPLSRKQRNCLQGVPRDTIAAYSIERK